jgi:sucrose phosphorylase
MVHDLEPDYHRPRWRLATEDRDRITGRLRALYGEEAATACMPELERILAVYHAYKPAGIIEAEKGLDPRERFTEKDVILITYGDQIQSTGHSHLVALGRFCDEYLEGTINTLHILPFFPYSSDRGFSVIDFETVDPALGTWEDIDALGRRYQLMFDGVVNHVSSKSRWFRAFRDGNPYYGAFFIAYSSPGELTAEQRRLIFRPRTTDILTRIDTLHGPRFVWTTFSDDQIDLDFKNPNVLLRVLEVLLLYVRRGADIIRLDAVTYLWEEPGTRCVHLEQTHEIVRLFRDVLNLVAPSVALITETNVPHQENISYFGNGRDEAQMVYNFALPPLVLHAFYTQDATHLSQWAATLDRASDTTTYLNFLDSHDGIGVMGVKDLLPPAEIDRLVATAQEHGALVSYKTAEDGTESPYEINTTWFSALNRDDGAEDHAFQVRRFVASRAIALVLPGVPGVYLHGLIGSRNDIEAVAATQSKRDINRAVIDAGAFTQALRDPESNAACISREVGRLILLRTRTRTFHPNGAQHVLTLSPRVFAVLRVSPDGTQRVLALTNVSATSCRLAVSLAELSAREDRWRDMLSGTEWMADEGTLTVTVDAYGVIWLEPVYGHTSQAS